MYDLSPSFDRFLTALRREKPDRVPLAESWVDLEAKTAFMGRPVKTLEDEVSFWTAAGYDFVPLWTDLYYTTQVPDSIVAPLANIAELYHEQRRDERACPEPCPEPRRRDWLKTMAGVIKTWDDVRRFPWPQADEFDYSPYEQVEQYLPPGMGVVTGSGHVFTATWQLMGFEAFCLSLYDDFALVKEVLDRLAKMTLESLEEILAFDVVGAVWMHDDIAYTNGLMIAPQWLRELFFPWVARYVELCHAKGRPFVYHSDGMLDKVLPDIVAAGVDALHPIEPKCMDIVTVKCEYGDRLALVGNVDLGYTLTRGTPQEVREEVKYLIKNVAPGGGYLLGSANSITDYVPTENYEALLDAAFEYGRYPITL